MKKLYTGLMAIILGGMSTIASAQQPALLISGFFANPAGNDDNKEFVELTATRALDFSVTPYSVVFNDGSNATTASGWVTGSNGSYAFSISTGTVAKGGKLYVGGNNISTYLSGGASCNTSTRNTSTGSGASGIGTGTTAGVLGNGGTNADGIGVFNVAAASLTATTVPIDAVFFGAGVGNATGKFPLPSNDKYSNAQGKFGAGTNTFVAPDPSSDLYVTATGSFDTLTNTWIGTGRTFGTVSLASATVSCTAASTITLTAANNLSLAVNSTSTTPFLAPPDVSGVINDATDPAANSGITFDIKDNGVSIPAASYTLTGSSTNTAMVPNANILITPVNGSATVKIVPAGVGYATITLTLNKSGLIKTYIISYAASAAVPATAVSHTGYSDGSSAYAIDTAYMVVVDDEKNNLNVYDRSHSGLPVSSYYFGNLLALTDLTGGIPREVDLEGITPSVTTAGRLYAIGSMSNQSGTPYNDRPNRNRIFAVALSGTGSTASFSLTGYYSSLRGDLISWGTANGLGLAASAAAGEDPKTSSGFNIEGMAFAPNNTTMYLGFRAPLLPVTARINALIAPVQNFETWFNNGSPAGSPTIGTPILLDLAGRGIREIYRQDTNTMIIIAGDVGSGTLTSQLYRWNGNPVDAPVLLPGFDLTGLNPEGLLNVTIGGVRQTNKLQLISDEGDNVYYADATAAKDLSTSAFKKFRSDLVTSPGQPLPVRYQWFDASAKGSHSVQLAWRFEGTEEIARFEVERSGDGAAFAPVGSVTAGIEKDYALTDLLSNDYEALYYRIKAVAYDGAAYYTNIRQVRMGGAAAIVQVYPNPVAGPVLHLSGVSTSLNQYRILNAAGRVVGAGSVDADTHTLDVSVLVPGFYRLELSGGGVTQEAAFIRQ